MCVGWWPSCVSFVMPEFSEATVASATWSLKSAPSFGCATLGHEPATKPFVEALEADEEGYLITETGSPRTSIPGIYAAGDCVDKVYRQAVTAAGMGCMAALEAEKYLAALEDSAAEAAE